MFVGIFLKNFKCYQGTQFIPGNSYNSKQFVSYLGDNGVGKSAILEALETFFSRNPRWFRNKESKKGSGECFVAPVFLIKDSNINKKYEGKIPNVTIESNEKIPPKHSLVCVAKREDGLFSFYDGKKEISSKYDIAKGIYQEIINLYKYIYIDAEVDIDKEVKIDSEVYELISGSSISNEVEKKFKEQDESSQFIKELNTILLNLVNDKLVRNLKKINPDYSYLGAGKGATSKLTSKILAKTSTRAFLDARKLKLKGKQLNDLSSGQRRVALIDFIVAVLKDKEFNKKKTLILAIDEPEISLDTSKKMNQFDKLTEIVEKNVSVMFSSHWYGWIASTSIGKSILIEESENSKREIKIFENSNFPFSDIPKYEMRMIFDFLMSLGASAETEKDKKFIVCEGQSDLIYLNASLNSLDYKIIPVGKRNVIKIANIFKDYFWKEQGPVIKNVLFIVDTDPEHRDKYENSYLRRWAKDDNLTITLSKGNDNSMHNKCVIEDALDSSIFSKALKEVYLDDLIQNIEIKHKELSGYESFGMDSVNNIEFKKITKNNKVELAHKYGEILLESNIPENKLKILIEDAFNSI